MLSAPASSVVAPDPSSLGQVFTPERVVRAMLRLRHNAGRVLEPSCGDGAFLQHLHHAVGIELDARQCPPGGHNMDFFAYPESEKFDTVIGNPPYVRYQDITPSTRVLLHQDGFDGRSNLYLFFIEKCVRHLAPGGRADLHHPAGFPQIHQRPVASTAGSMSAGPSPTPSSWVTPASLPTPCPTV
jgi:adenine-specific DNA-methyltransferase